MELNKRDQELLAMGAKMKTLEEQHHDYQRHIAVLKESLCAKEEHYNMLQADVSHIAMSVVVIFWLWSPFSKPGVLPKLVEIFSTFLCLY